ncbi:hypothetical protein NC651_011651 [Populus alba x Populus x berolinensis]|nr:hypothetical protein NC651_011651 [Populus alba x Populus x berolinensis]
MMMRVKTVRLRMIKKELAKRVLLRKGGFLCHGRSCNLF